MGALGYVMQVPEEEKYLNSEKEMRENIIVFMAGRAAEKLKFDSITTGASNDIEKATNIARRMITMYGMSDEFGPVALESVESQYLEGRTVLNCSEETAAKIDEAVMKVLKKAYEDALSMLSENMEVMDKLAAHLIEKETITGKEFMEIFRREKGLPDPEEEKKGEENTESTDSETKDSVDTPSDTVTEEQNPAPGSEATDGENV